MLHVASKKLNLRSEPKVKPSTLIVGLPFGQPVKPLADSNRSGWKIVETDYQGSVLTGHVSGRYLRDPVSQMKEAALSKAAVEWDRFDRGSGKETKSPFYKYIGEMWSARGLPYDGRDTSQYWSAAFISFVLENANYANFKFSIAHSNYIHESILARETGDETKDFWGFRTNEHKPRLCDLVARRRTSASYINYDYAMSHHQFPSHTDLVVAVGEGYVDTVGGNVSNSVSVTRYRLLNSGYLDSRGGRIFAVMRNNL